MCLPIRLLMLSSTVRHNTTSPTHLGRFRLPTYAASLDFHRSTRSRTLSTQILRCKVRHHALDLLPHLDFALALRTYGINPYIDERILDNVKPGHRCKQDLYCGRATISTKGIRSSTTVRFMF